MGEQGREEEAKEEEGGEVAWALTAARAGLCWWMCSKSTSRTVLSSATISLSMWRYRGSLAPSSEAWLMTPDDSSGLSPSLKVSRNSAKFSRVCWASSWVAWSRSGACWEVAAMSAASASEASASAVSLC